MNIRLYSKTEDQLLLGYMYANSREQPQHAHNVTDRMPLISFNNVSKGLTYGHPLPHTRND